MPVSLKRISVNLNDIVHIDHVIFDGNIVFHIIYGAKRISFGTTVASTNHLESMRAFEAG